MGSSANFVPRLKVKTVNESQEMRQDDQRYTYLETLAALDCLDGVPEDELHYLVDLCVFRAFGHNSTIMRERRPGEFLYVLLQGSLRLTLHDKEGHEVVLGILGPGDCFGEGPLFGDHFRRTGAYAETDCYALQLPLADLRTLLPRMPGLDNALKHIYRRRLVESTLARVPLFSRLSPVERLSLAELLHPQHHPRGSTIIYQGECGRALFLIESGQVIVENHNQMIATLDEGDFFGETALLSNQPHTANVRALTPIDVLALPAAEFDALLVRRPDLKFQLESVVAQRRANNELLRRDHGLAQMINLVVEKGMMRGSHLLVRNPDLCDPNCHICETACTTRHGNQRLQVNGVMLNDVDVVDACRQCRVGAECVEACPEDAFEWNDDGALFINDKCTGCGACVPACPYDAVSRVSRGATVSDGPLWQLWHSMKRLHNPTLHAFAVEPAYSHRADKCDLCHGYDDLACVSACPTGAMHLVPVEELLPL